jgi:spermidine synthase
MLLSLVIICFTLSGFAALLYQTAWMRLFAIEFGTSDIAVALVLAGYMGGLALGAAITARYVGRIRRPVLVYGLLEGAIAVAALMLPWLLDLVAGLYVFFAGDQPLPPDASAKGQLLYFSISSFAVLLIPTAFMGATLPLLAHYAVTSNRNLGSRISVLYSMNTAGAVAGTLFAAFILLPALGLRGTTWIGVLANGIVFIVAIMIARMIAAAPLEKVVAKSQPSGMRFVLPLIALSGALSFLYEVLWTRMLSHVLGSSIYAFATMLSAFLAGITIGAAAAGPVARNPRVAMALFAACQFAIAIASAFVYWRIEQSVPGNSDAVLAFAVILPSTVFIGATFPLAIRSFAGGVADVGRSSAVVYSWNTVGAILGALLGGFLIVPKLGFAGSAQFAVIANLCIGMLALLLWARADGWRATAQWRLAAAATVFVAATILFQPGRPDALVTRAHFGGSGEQIVSEIYYSVGRSSTVLMTENAARFDLSTNGLPEAQIEFKGAPPMLLSQRWLGIWPSLARPEADSMLVIGLGGGVVLEGVPDSIGTVHVVELEADVVAANELIAERRERSFLARKNLQMVVNDARNALRLTSRKYDAIVSQPSHPWTAGASHLFTREFFALVKSRLNEDGVFVQWMNAEFLDEVLLRELAATLLSEFKHVRVYQPSALALHFVASNGPLDIERQLDATGMPLLEEPGHYSRNGIHGAVDLIATLLLDEHAVELLAEQHAPITDDDNRMAVDSNVRAAGLNAAALTAITSDIDPLLDADSWARRMIGDADLIYVARRLLTDGQTERVQLMHDLMEPQSVRTLLQATLLRYQGLATESYELLRDIDSGDAVFEQAVFMLVEDRLAAMQGLDDSPKQLAGSELRYSRLGAVLQGWLALEDSDWQQLAELETRLSETKSSDLWVPYAARLRAEWRLQVDDADGVLAQEALLLLDSVSATSGTRSIYSQRARAGQILGDASVFTESVAFLVRSMNDRLWYLDYYGQALSEIEYRWINGQLDGFDPELRRLTVLDEDGRAALVLRQASELRKSLLFYQPE